MIQTISLNTQTKLRNLKTENKENFGICSKQMKNRKAFITGISSTYLKKNEINFLKTHKPWGVVLFSRNINNFDQTKKLINKIKSLFHDNRYPILIDEEGGRVSRLKKIIDTSIFSSKFFGKLYLKNKYKMAALKSPPHSQRC